ncbi:MAG: hypothetical protein A3K67_00355 [Euryarchaeota archaeon RBG_16_62_10]|nr:MAG: hypothetical protein A3K67_00355 [Euryarchaeota archaeon RBG_16_62_10]
MLDAGLVASLLLSTGAGVCVGISAGLVPGLHMNNIAAALVAYAGAAVGLFSAVNALSGGPNAGLLVASFVASALVAHMFAEAITSTYIGIPSEDMVSVLPAHRLAKAGYGSVAVRASVDGSLVGTAVATAVFLPSCLLMGEPVGLYSLLKKVMLFVVIGFSVVLVLADGDEHGLRVSGLRRAMAHRVKAATSFLASGLLGFLVLQTDYASCGLPDLPWMTAGFVQRSALLLPMFAGLFGLPSLLMSLMARPGKELHDAPQVSYSFEGRASDLALAILGGTLVGWLPGMTSGCAATVCAPGTREHGGEGDLRGSARFIWLYSAISSSGVVFALAALFVISRARSGSMDAISFFVGDGEPGFASVGEAFAASSLLLSCLVSALVSHRLVRSLEQRLAGLQRLLCSRRTAVAAVMFVVALSCALTGSRGMLVMAAATTMGLIPPLAGVRRIQLMGCLLVPVALVFAGVS